MTATREEMKHKIKQDDWIVAVSQSKVKKHISTEWSYKANKAKDTKNTQNR